MNGRSDANNTKFDDFWMVWDADQDVFTALAQTEGAARSGGTYRVITL